MQHGWELKTPGGLYAKMAGFFHIFVAMPEILRHNKTKKEL